MKILILKPSSLGDVVQALPVLRLLKQHQPSNEIFWWIFTELAPVLEGDPDLTGLYAFDRRRWASPRGFSEFLKKVRIMRRQRFDWVIDLQGLARSAIVSWLARGRLTVGVDDRREGAGAFYDLRVPRPSYDTHAVDWYLNVLSALGVPVHSRFDWLPVRVQAAARLQSKWQAQSARWILLNPGARWLNKRWPVESFVALAQKLRRDLPHLRIAVLGGEAEFDAGERICQTDPVHCLNLAGQTSISEMIEWIRVAELIITNDTGPMHVAAALGKPIVAMFGPTNPLRTGPYGKISEVVQVPLPCAPCMKSTCSNPKPLECLTAISADAVLQKVRQTLHNAGTL